MPKPAAPTAARGRRAIAADGRDEQDLQPEDQAGAEADIAVVERREDASQRGEQRAAEAPRARNTRPTSTPHIAAASGSSQTARHSRPNRERVSQAARQGDSSDGDGAVESWMTVSVTLKPAAGRRRPARQASAAARSRGFRQRCGRVPSAPATRRASRPRWCWASGQPRAGRRCATGSWQISARVERRPRRRRAPSVAGKVSHSTCQPNTAARIMIWPAKAKTGAMGQIGAMQDAVDQRIAEGQQRIERARDAGR